MHLEELGDGEPKGEEIEISNISKLGLINPKRAAVGVGARMLFYPTLLYNVVRNRFEPQFNWWDQVDEVCSPVLPVLFYLYCYILVS